MRYVAVQLYAAHNSDAGRMGYFLVQVVLFRRKPYVIISVVALGSYKVICVEELHGYSDQGRYCIACICSSNFYFFCNSDFLWFFWMLRCYFFLKSLLQIILVSHGMIPK